MTVGVELSLTRTFVATHALPTIGFGQPHEHTFKVECGYSALIDAEAGCERPLQEMEAELHSIISLIDHHDLNAVLPVQPTAEMLACWILSRLPERWQWAAVTAYGGYTCRVARSEMPSFLRTLHGSASGDP